jgi:hypothetical protein
MMDTFNIGQEVEVSNFGDSSEPWAKAKIGKRQPVIGVNGLFWYHVTFPDRKRRFFDTNHIRAIATKEESA